VFESLEVFRTAHAMARHAGQRQALVARNVANADTPDYRPQDLAPFKTHLAAGTQMKATRVSHLNAGDALAGSVIVTDETSELSPNGNGVSVEDEMLRAVDVKRQHDRALAVYRHSLTVLRSSLGKR